MLILGPSAATTSPGILTWSLILESISLCHVLMIIIIIMIIIMYRILHVAVYLTRAFIARHVHFLWFHVHILFLHVQIEGLTMHRWYADLCIMYFLFDKFVMELNACCFKILACFNNMISSNLWSGNGLNLDYSFYEFNNVK